MGLHGTKELQSRFEVGQTLRRIERQQPVDQAFVMVLRKDFGRRVHEAIVSPTA
jgi:hypothetical protein